MSEKEENDWPADLDAMVAAPDHHTVLFENERVRVLDSLVKPGDATPVHTHRWPSVLYIIGSSDFVRYDAAGRILVEARADELEPGTTVWSPPLRPHFVRNVGPGEIRVISIELKDTADNQR